MRETGQLGLRPRRYHYESEFAKLTHYLFRYPAKFHPPVVRQLIEDYSAKGERVFDPFCGSGTLLVEAAVAGRNARGTDCDPVAVFVSSVKTWRYRISHLRATTTRLLGQLERYERPEREYKERQYVDLTMHEAEHERGGLWIPGIPRIEHWFRRYVVVDLARILDSIHRLRMPESHRAFLRLCFASILRASSNADPVPVSGLEVTSHMRRRDETGRIVNPFQLLRMAVRKGVDAAEEYCEAVDRSVVVSASVADATKLSGRQRDVDVVITSPPYHNAVDYYRRHTLEMYWLGFTQTQEERLALKGNYVGTAKVRQSHPFLTCGSGLPSGAARWERRIREVSDGRADSFRHYVAAMQRVFSRLYAVLRPGGRAVFVIGKSAWNGVELPSTELFAETSGERFRVVEHLWYPVKNRYMSYDRHNGANIDREEVLVFEVATSVRGKKARPKQPASVLDRV